MQKNNNAMVGQGGGIAQPDWVASGEALRRVMAVYAERDTQEYGSEEIAISAASWSAKQAIIRRLQRGSLVARSAVYSASAGFDEIPLDPETGTIPKQFWSEYVWAGMLAEADWTAGDFSYEREVEGEPYYGGFAHGVEFFRSALPGLSDNAADSVHASLPETVSAKFGGAPRKWDWDGALLHLAARAHSDPNGLFRPDGSEPNQSDIADYLREWFIGITDDAPSGSQLRDYGKRFLIELNALKLKIADNS